MTNNDLKPDFGTNVYIFSAVGAVLGGVLGASVMGFPPAIGAIIVGALSGGILGYYMLKL